MLGLLSNLRRLLGILAISTVVVSCATDDTAPGNSASSAPADPIYTHGKQIYRTKCAKCHAPEPVRRYSPAEWEELMPEMIEETNLNSAEITAVWSYIRTELR